MNFRGHSIKSEIILPDIPKRVAIDLEDLKTFSMGPDALITTCSHIFSCQHANKVREFFLKMFQIIKEKRLQENATIMAFVYGQISHYVVDLYIHPLIYYMTAEAPKIAKMDMHALVETWLDDYLNLKYQIDEHQYYHHYWFNDPDLKKLVNQLYSDIYFEDNMNFKYNLGYFNNSVLYDNLIRHNALGITKPVTKVLKIGDIVFSDDISRLEPYLNMNHKFWFNPENMEVYQESFEDLWHNVDEVILQTISDVNDYLYLDRPLKNIFILKNISYNTGLPCEMGQTLKYVKKY